MKYAALILVAIMITSCSNYKYVRTNGQPHDQLNKDQVTLYLDQSKVPSDYQEMGLIICKTNKEHKAIKHARKLAAKNGANGIYILSQQNISGWQHASNALLGTNYKNKIRVVAFKTN